MCCVGPLALFCQLSQDLGFLVFFFLEISGMSYSLHVGLDTLLWARGKSVESWQALASG